MVTSSPARYKSARRRAPGVPPVCFHFVPRGLGDERRGCHLAGDAHGGELALQVVARRAGFVDDPQALRRALAREEPAHRGVVGHQRRHLGGVPARDQHRCGYRDLVDVEAYPTEVLAGDTCHGTVGSFCQRYLLVCGSPHVAPAIFGWLTHGEAGGSRPFHPDYAACFAVLRPGGILAVVTKNTRRKGRTLDLAGLTVALAEAAGFTYLQHVVALHAAIRDSDLVARPSFWQRTQAHKARTRGEPAHLVVHEDVEVFSAGPAQLAPTTQETAHAH
jgi:hypothetical protein